MEKPPSRLYSIYMTEWSLLHRIAGVRHLHMLDMARRADIQKGQSVLELGGGAYPYYYTLGYAERVGSTGRYVVVDNDPFINAEAQRVIERKRQRDVRRGRQRTAAPVEIVTADATHLPHDLFPDNSFNIVIINNLTTPDFEEEALRVLKPGGRVQIAHGELTVPFYARRQKRLLRKAGYINIKIRPGVPMLPIQPFFLNWYVTAEKPLETSQVHEDIRLPN